MNRMHFDTRHVERLCGQSRENRKHGQSDERVTILKEVELRRRTPLVVSGGKYAGQHAETMARDGNYCAWACKQTWWLTDQKELAEEVALFRKAIKLKLII